MKSGTTPSPCAGWDRQPPYRKWYPCTGWLAESLLKRLALSSTEPQRLGINGAGRNIARYFDPCRPRAFRASQLRCAARWRARLFSGVAGMSMWVMPSGLRASTTAFMIAASARTLPASPAPLMRYGPTRRLSDPWYPPRSGATSPPSGSRLISLSARFIRFRSRTPMRRSDRAAPLLSRKAQLTL